MKVLKPEIILQIKENTEVLVNKKITDKSLEVKEYVSSAMIIPPNTIDLEVNFGGVSVAKFLFLNVKNQISIRLNEVTNTSIPLSGVFVVQSEVSRIYVTNLNNEEVVLEYLAIE